MSEQDFSTGGSVPVGGIDAAPRAVTAFFDTEDMAEKARADLVAAGVPAAAVRVAGGASPSSPPDHPHGFWEALKSFFMPEEDRHIYAEGLRRGGFAVSVDTDSAAYNHVLEILDRDGAVDMEERSAGWRDEGWSGYPAPSGDERSLTPPGAGTAGFGASMADQPLLDAPLTTREIERGLVSAVTEDKMRDEAAGTPDVAYAAAAPGLGDTARESTAMTGQTQPAPAAATATRDLSHGRTRVRSYLGRPDGLED